MIVRVYTLQCYTGDGEMNKNYTMQETQCKEKDHFCEKSDIISKTKYITKRGCAESCIEGTSTVSNVNITKYCCTTDFCNGSLIEKPMNFLFVGAALLLYRHMK